MNLERKGYHHSLVQMKSVITSSILIEAWVLKIQKNAIGYLFFFKTHS